MRYASLSSKKLVPRFPANLPRLLRRCWNFDRCPASASKHCDLSRAESPKHIFGSVNSVDTLIHSLNPA